jgi:prepilin-type processing-associated H-X9-DG protein
VNYADDDLNWLYVTYIPNGKVFTCPSTKNTVITDASVPAKVVNMFPTDTGKGNQTPTVPRLYTDRLHGASVYYRDLQDNSPQGKEGTTGSSYEVAGFFCGQSPATSYSDSANVRKTQGSLNSHTYRTPQSDSRYQFHMGQKVSPSSVWIIYDADDSGAGGPNEDYPDSGDNHGADGGNVVFGDGHAEWVSQKKYVGSFILGTDERPVLYH